MEIRDLPAVNATLNGISTLFLACGYYFIRRLRKEAHRRCMMGAGISSSLFLISYLTYHFTVTGVTRFQGQGWVRGAYFFILITHVILAAGMVPLVLMTFFRAWRGEYERHRRWAVWTWPIWMYVSVTGVVIYVMLYHLYPK